MTDNRLIRRLETIAGLNDEDKLALRQLPLRKRAFDENCDLVSQGDKHFAGDLPDLQSLYLDRMDHGVRAAFVRSTHDGARGDA